MLGVGRRSVRIRTLKIRFDMNINIEMKNEEDGEIVIDNMDDLKKMRKIHKKINKLIRKYAPSTVAGVTITWGEGIYKNLQFDKNQKFDKIIIDSVTDNILSIKL